MSFLDCPAVMTGRAEQTPSDLSPLANRQNHVFEHAQPPEQRGDLESADEAAFDPSGLRQMGDFNTVEANLPGIRAPSSGYKLANGRAARRVRGENRCRWLRPGRRSFCATHASRVPGHSSPETIEQPEHTAAGEN